MIRVARGEGRGREDLYPYWTSSYLSLVPGHSKLQKRFIEMQAYYSCDDKRMS